MHGHETEADFLRVVLEAAKLFGWRVAHFRPARTSKGWRTAVSADGQGFPDLVLVREPRVIFAELKSDKGKVADEQQEWIGLLEGCKGVETYIWRPGIWEDILAILGYQEKIKNKEEKQHG